MASSGINVPKYSIDPIQRKAAESGSRVTIITGGPQTGKSHSAVSRVAFLLESGCPPEQITCIGATPERVANLSLLMRSHPRVLANSDRLFVGTVLELANSLVRLSEGWKELSVPSNYSVWNDTQTVEVIAHALAGLGGIEVKRTEIREAIAWSRRNRWSGKVDEEIPAADARLEELADLCQREKLWLRVLDTDDVLYTAAEAVEKFGKGELDEYSHWLRCNHLLVDGVEDFNQREIKLLALLAGGSDTLTLTTDENQRIRGSYSGSKVYGVRPQDRGADVHHLELTQTGTTPLSVAAALLRRSDEMEGLRDYEQVWERVAGPNPRLVEVPGTNRDMAVRVVADAVARHDQGVAWKDIVILCKTSTAMKPLLTLLVHRDTPYRIVGRKPADRISDADCVRAMLTCLINPYDLYAVRVSVGARHPNRGLSLNGKTSGMLWRMARALDLDLVTAAETFLRQCEEPQRADLSWLVESHRHLRSILEGPGCDLTTLLAHALVQVRGLAGPCSIAGDETVVDFRTDRLWQDAAHNAAQTDGEPLEKQLVRFLDRTSAVLDADRGASDPDALTVSTWDAIKGRHWPVVLVFDVSDETIPGGAGVRGRRYQERLWYTITTRATRELVYYCLTDIGLGNNSRPTRYLEPLRPLLEAE
ncbi:MAG: ATP-dependent helicase [Chloroflexi bacterium]|nr:ATP-dependent helicase [Chloroflexota bacterium]